MKLSSIFEQDPAQAAAIGANVLKKTLGANTSGSMVSKALGKLDQGGALSGPLAKALSPYADALEKILSDPMYRNKFMQMMKQIQTADKKQQPAQMAAPQESVSEDQDSVDAVASSITRRIMMQHTELLSKYGPVKVMAAIDDVAEFAGGDGLDEIGSSDVSGWTKQVIQDLEAGHYDHVDENAEINRVRKLAGLPEGMVDIEYGVDPKLQKLVDIGHLLRKTLDVGSGVKWDDADFNKAANLADALISLGATFGPKNLKDALKLADMDIAQAQELIAKASQRAPVEEAEQLDEILPVLGAMAGRAAFAGAGAVTRGAASMAGRAVGSAAQSALDDNDEDPTDDASNSDEVDTVSMDVPLLLRVLEFAREEVEDDMVLHDIVERLVAMSKEGPLSMDDYESIVGSVEALPAPEEKPMDEGYYAPGPETMPGAVGPQETTTVSFNQSKQMGDATLNINASAKDMEELHRILKLAGIDYANDGAKQEPNMKDVALALEPHAPETSCGCDDETPQDVKYSTDKQTLINVLRNKLQKRLA